MSGRRWAAVVVVIAVALIVALLHPCGDAGETPRPTTPEPSTTRVDPVAVDAAARPPRRAAAPEDATKASTEAAPPAVTSRATVVVRVVVEEDKKPVAGVEVLLVEDTQGRPEVEHRAPTDAAGVAKFDVPPGSVSAMASGPEWVRSDFTGGTVEAGEERKFELALERGVALAGVVVDARTGRPIAGATVEVILGGSLDGFGSSGTSAPPLGKLTTGEDGRFRLRVPPNEMVTPTVSARGFVAQSRTVLVPVIDKPRPPLELSLEPSGTLRGTVRAPNGSAVAGASVFVRRGDDEEVLLEGRRERDAAKTDDSGRFEIVGLERGGVYFAHAWAEGWARSVGSRGVLVTDETPVADVDFLLRGFGAFVLRVVDADGAPRSAQVDGGEAGWPRVTDALGVARFDRATPGSYSLEVVSVGLPKAQVSVQVREDATSEVTVRLERGAEIQGTVVDDLGRPVGNAEIYVARIDERNPRFIGPTRTDERGAFRIGGLPATRHRLSAATIGGSTSGQADAPSNDVRLVLPRPGGAALTLLAARGIEIPARVKVQPQRAEGADESWGVGWIEADVRAGRFEIGSLSPGAWRLRVVVDGAAPVLRQFEVAAGATTDLGETTLDPGLALAGVVEDFGGTPVLAARVSVGPRFLPGYQQIVTAADGRFRFAHLARGRNDVKVAALDFVATTIHADVVPGDAPLVVRLPHGGIVRTTVIDAAGVPVPATTVEIRPVGTASAPADTERTDHRGRAEMRVAPGRWRVSVEGKDAGADVDVTEGSGVSVRLPLR